MRVGHPADRVVRADDARPGTLRPRELLGRLAADVGAEEVQHGLLAERAQQRELDRLRQQRQPEVEVEDVRLRREPRERAPLRQLLPDEAAAAPEVDVRLRMQPVAVEDDEPRVDAAPPERLDVRPRDAGSVDGAVRDAHEATLPRELLRLCDQLVERRPPACFHELGRALGSERLAQRLERPLVLGDLLLRDLHRDRLEGAGGPADESRGLLRLPLPARQLARGAEQVREQHPVVEPHAELERLA